MDATRLRAAIPVALAGSLALAAGACSKAGESRDVTQKSGGAVAEGKVAAAEPRVGQPSGDRAAGDEPAEITDEVVRDTYTVVVDAPEGAPRGERGTVTVRVTPKEGWKMNKDFPTELAVTAPDGVEVAKAEQSVKDAVHFGDGKGEWEVGFTPETAGEKTFTANFKFAVCTDASCVPKREKLAWVVDVQ